MAKKEKKSAGKKLQLAGHVDPFKLEKKLAKQHKRELRSEADRARFQHSDRKSISAIVGNREADATKKSVPEGPTAPQGQMISGAASSGKSTAVLAKHQLAAHASTVLALALGVFLLMSLLTVSDINGAKAALYALSGTAFISNQDIADEIFRSVFLLDTLFPILLAAGFAMLLTAVQTRGNRPLVRLGLSALLVGLIADVSENATVFAAVEGGSASPFQVIFTVVKFASLALASVIASALVPSEGLFGNLVNILLRFILPFIAALSIASINADQLFGYSADILSAMIGICFIATLMMLSIYAMKLSEPIDD